MLSFVLFDLSAYSFAKLVHSLRVRRRCVLDLFDESFRLK